MSDVKLEDLNLTEEEMALLMQMAVLLFGPGELEELPENEDEEEDEMEDEDGD